MERGGESGELRGAIRFIRVATIRREFLRDLAG